jgi:hypothetical protein
MGGTTRLVRELAVFFCIFAFARETMLNISRYVVTLT